MTARIALAVVEPGDGELMGWPPDRLAGPGYALVLVPGQHEQPRPARAYWLTDDAVRAAAGRHGADQPGLDPDVGGRGGEPVRLVRGGTRAGRRVAYVHGRRSR